jgi:hypothetical protein
MLRLFHEHDLSHVPYHGCGQPFIDAWRRVVGIFQQQGATNVGFWWTPTEGGNRSCVSQSYPGDAYVDWAGSDTYNMCMVGDSSCWATSAHSGWAEFSEIADYGSSSQHDTWGPRKPFVIGETGTYYDPNSPARKGDWFRKIPAAARNMEWLRGICFYDADVSAVEGSNHNFRVDHSTTNPDVYAGFVAMSRDSWAG